MNTRKILTIVVYTIIILLIGRNLSFLPQFFKSQEVKGSDTSEVKEAIISYLKDKNGSYSVYYKNLSSDKKDDFFGINEKEMHTVASVNKVAIASVLYSLASKGEINLDEKVVIQEEDIQDYGTGSLRYEEPGKSYSLKTLTKLSLKESDNTAAHILANRIGRDKITDTIYSWGLTQTTMEGNKSTAFDIGILFEKIYRHEIMHPSYALELLSFMKDTDFEDRLPALLPNANVYHKTGDAVGGTHDAGIVEYGKHTYFVGVLASDIGDKEVETKKIIAEVSKIIFDKTSLK